MASQVTVPRFLLPLKSPLWRSVRVASSAPTVAIRYASSDAQHGGSKPIVLEKPLRFNPPSHGSRLKRSAPLPKHYGPKYSEAEVAAQNSKHYPGVMSPEGTWSHWFWHSRLLHTFITMGTLCGLGVATFFMNYAYNSPFKDLVPPISDLWTHPIYFFTAWKNVIVMHEQDKSAKAQEHRTRHLDDVAKRRYYMKMHGIEPKDPVSMVFGGGKEQSEAELEAAALGREPPVDQEAEKGEKNPPPRRKLFGIF